LKAFSRAVEKEGLASPPVGLDKIETQTKRDRRGKESGGSGRGEEKDEWEGTHRADKKRREVKRKKGVLVDLSEDESVEEGGTGFQQGVLDAVGDITEEDIRGQKEEFDRLAKERASRRKSKEDSSESGLGGNEEDYDRIMEDLKQGSGQKRKRSGGGGGGEGGGGGGGSSGVVGDGHREGRPAYENAKTAPEVKKNERAAARRRARRGNRVEEIGPEATRFITEWGVAKLKGVDLSECSGVLVEEGEPCKREFNKGVKAQSEGNVVLMK
jgi:hypothetical protein